ncbi:MAG: hypothetical protein ACRCYP_05935 [Alphaproteobacteria bacterium]
MMSVRKKMLAACVFFLSTTCASNALMYVRYWNKSSKPITLDEVSRGAGEKTIAPNGEFKPDGMGGPFMQLQQNITLSDGTVISVRDTQEMCKGNPFKYVIRSQIKTPGTSKPNGAAWNKEACISLHPLDIVFRVKAIITDGGIEFQQD